ncbi:protein kinase family protein [Acidothermaceae bacterium B102]|nr:protein kinase family protein [Acidothermaceae bacterium B102]
MPTPPAPLAPGSLVTGRYRLLRQVGSATSTLWEAHDDVLARPVAIRSLPTDSATDAVLEAARRAGVVPHRTLTRAYDVVDEPDLRLVVREWVAGEPLDAVVAEAPLSPERAMAVIGSVAEALAAAATYGVHHGRLHPGHVLITPEGDVRVTDAATAAAIVGAPAGDDADDVTALGSLLYFALTGRWPGDDASGLPPAPTEEGRLCSPRQVRAGVPRDLDRLVTDCLLWGPTTPASAAEVVTRLTTLRHAGEPTQVIQAVVEPDPPPARRLRIPIVVAAVLAVLLLGYVVVLGLVGSSGVGEPFDLLRHNATTTTSAGTSPSPGTSTSAGASGAASPTTYPLATANSFDPPPGDGSEEQSHARYAIDNDPATFWYTERYNQADFGRRKPGVGLLVDAGTAVAPSQVTVDFLEPGTTFDIRSADTAATTLDGFTAQGDATTATTTSASVTITDKTPHRYWLLWITHLPAIPGGFRSSVTTFALDR